MTSDDDKNKPKKYGPFTGNQWSAVVAVLLILAAGGYWYYTNEYQHPSKAVSGTGEDYAAVSGETISSTMRFY